MSRVVPPNPSNASTPSFTTVSSSAGFQSGDLVYYKDSAFNTIQNNAVTSGDFPIVSTVNLGQNAFNTTVGWANYTPDNRPGSTTTRAPSCALLTNGNIVVVYGETISGTNPEAVFKIIDQNGAVVVGRTSTGRTLSGSNNGCIGVAALTGGGFALVLAESTPQLFYGVYSNTGAVVTALAADTFFGSASQLDVKPLPNGGFVIATNSSPTSSGSYRTRVYSATGVGGNSGSVTGWATVGVNPIIGVYTDNSFGVLIPTGSTSIDIYRFGTTGSFINQVTITSGGYSSNGSYDFIVLSDNTGRAFFCESSSSVFQTAAFSVSSAGVVASIGNLGGTSYTQFVNAAPLSGGGYLLLRPASSTGNVNLARFNVANTLLTQLPVVGLAAYAVSSATQYARTTMLEGATWLTLVDNMALSTSFTYGTLPFVQVDKSNITITGLRERITASATTGLVNAPVSTYSKANSTPNAASFLSSTTQTISRSIPASTGTTFALTPYNAITEAVTWQSMTEMNNGQFVIAYRTVGGAVRFSVFNQDASFNSNVTVVSSGTADLVRCTCLGNGKLVISYVPTANNNIVYSIYSSSYVLLATANASTQYGTTLSSPASTNGGAGHDIAPFGNDFFVTAFTWAGGATTSVSVYNDSGVYQNRQDVGLTPQNIQLASDASGNVAFRGFASGTGYTYYYARGASASSIITLSTSSSTGNYDTANFNDGFALLPNGVSAGYINNSSNRRLWKTAPTSAFELAVTGGMSVCAGALAVGQSGELVALVLVSGSQYFSTYGPHSSQGPYGTSVGTSVLATGTLTLTDIQTSSPGSRPQIVNLYDNLYAFSYITTAGLVKVGILCTTATTYSANITTGVTPSATALVPSPANGYYLAGVAASDCTAGGTGVLQVNGSATLNSQYPAGTPSQSFDFNSASLDSGVRGTISGRNMTISGGN